MVGISTLGQSISQISRLKEIQENFSLLQYQLATGRKSMDFKGLGDDVLSSTRARTSINSINRYDENINLGNIKLDIMLRSVQESVAQTTNIMSMVDYQIQEGEIDFEEVADFATDIYERTTQLMNSKYDNKFLFAGSDTNQKPITDIGTMDTFTQTGIQDWIDGTIDTDQLITYYESANDTTLGFSASLASGEVRGVFVRSDTNTDVNYTVLANEQPYKDVLGALKMLKNLAVLDKVSLDQGDNPTSTVTAPGLDADEQQENFYKLYNHLVDKINNSIPELRKIEVRINRVQLDLQSQQGKHAEDKNLLQSVLDDIENADMTDVAIRINTLQVQLDASFRVTAALQSLTLSNYI